MVRKINYPKSRKSPHKHTVKSHSRKGHPVRSFKRGRGSPSTTRKRRKNSQTALTTKQRVFVIPKKHVMDKRFSPFLQEKWSSQYRDVQNYLTGRAKVLATVTNGEYTVKITDDFRVLYFHNDRMREPVPMGLWMDWPEKHWKITEEEYRELPIKTRAKLEANEQLTKWIRKEYYTGWLSTYKPKIYEKMWWDGLSSYSIKHGIAGENKKLKPIVKRFWRGQNA